MYATRLPLCVRKDSCEWISVVSLILTEAGRSIAEITLEKHQFFSAMLMEAGVDPKTAEKEACRIEHAISTESFERLKRLKKEYTNHSTGGTCAD